MNTSPSHRRPRFGAIAAAGLLLGAPLAAPAEDCNELIRLGLYNISNSVNVYDAQVAAYNHLCSESYSSSGSDKQKSQGINFGFLNISLGWNGSKGTALNQTSWSRVCEDSDLRNQLYTYSSASSQQIADNALIAWQSCLAMKARGLRTDIRPTSNLTGVSFDLFWLGSSPAWFRGLDQPDIGQASCTVSIPGNTTAAGTKTATSTTAFKLSAAAATFVCRRQMATLADNTQYSDALRLTVKTSDGSFDIDLPALGLRQVATVEMDDLYSRLASLEDRGWNPIPKLTLGSLRLDQIGTKSYSIPQQVPAGSSEVLVYAMVATGWATQGLQSIRIYTADGRGEYAHLLHAVGYDQRAWGYNSDTFWLPLTSGRQIHATSSGTPISGSQYSEVSVLGYR